MMITATTKLDPVRPEDGGLLDRDPERRARRLQGAGVRIERPGPLHHVVHFPDGASRRFRTFGAAERTAHTYLDRRPQG
jgi:hypothetical protein